MTDNSTHDFIAYEYKIIPMSGERASMYLDCYTSLGWEPDHRSKDASDSIVLRRNRKIINKVELTRLGRHMEACMAEIEALVKSVKRKATVVSLTIGMIGTAFMAGSVFAVTAEAPMIPLCIVLAVPGFLLWALAPLLYSKLTTKRAETVRKLVEQKYDEIYEICEKGNKLLT